ncbi:MAG: hypothetical protein HC913_13385 [Microscillaceae bacterium]|nr:hypothetical protein [Microscillaceae bacterium]
MPIIRFFIAFLLLLLWGKCTSPDPRDAELNRQILAEYQELLQTQQVFEEDLQNWQQALKDWQAQFKKTSSSDPLLAQHGEALEAHVEILRAHQKHLAQFQKQLSQHRKQIEKRTEGRLDAQQYETEKQALLQLQQDFEIRHLEIEEMLRFLKDAHETLMK